MDSLKFATDELNLNDLIVGCDGAFIYDSSAGKVLDIHTLPTERARELIRLCRKLDVILFFDYVDYAVYEKSTRRWSV
jgi:hydroxymethylpyrimidine pyrophosphatase-like HAD family hydrolase